LAAERLNEKELGFERNLSRFVSLVHTEGCATSGTGLDELLIRTLLGYATHPMVRCCLLLEHGCEKNHNDGLQRELKQLGYDPHRFGWASVQLDGGMNQVFDTIELWFAEALSIADPVEQKIVGLDRLSLGMLSSGSLSPPASAGLAQLMGDIVASGGTVVVPEGDGLLASVAFAACIRDTDGSEPTLAYGGRISTPGLHIMQVPSEHWVEAQTGLGATGVHIMLAYVGDGPKQGNPMIPVIQVTSEAVGLERWREDLDLVLGGDPAHWSQEMLRLLIETFLCEYSPRSFEQGNVDFQITRGSLGISL
jgi:altronate dehydratase